MRRQTNPLVLAAIFSALLAFFLIGGGCSKGLRVSSPVPPPTPCCSYQEIALPGAGAFTEWILGGTPTPQPSVPDRGVIRIQADWVSYCARMGVDPSAPPPVDLSKRMILYRLRDVPECLTATSLVGVDCQSDRIVATVLNVTDYTLTCPWPDHVEAVGYVMDQAQLPVFWTDRYQTIGTPPVFPSF